MRRLRESGTTMLSIEGILLQGGLFRLSVADASALAGYDVAALSLDEVNQTLPIAIKGMPLSATVIQEREPVT